MNYADLFRVTLPETALEIAALLVLVVDLGFLRTATLRLRTSVAALLGVLGCLAALLTLSYQAQGGLTFPPTHELLLAVGELKILASEKAVTTIEVEEDKLKITRHGDFFTLGGKFPRLTKKDAKARLKEIKRLLLAI